MFNVEPERSVDEILADVNSSSVSAFNNKNIALVFPSLAALLVKLNRASSDSIRKNIAAQERLISLLDHLGTEARETTREAANTADKILRFTKWLFWATVILLIATILLVSLEIMKFNEPANSHSKSNKAKQESAVQINKLPAPTTQLPQIPQAIKKPIK